MHDTENLFGFSIFAVVRRTPVHYAVVRGNIAQSLEPHGGGWIPMPWQMDDYDGPSPYEVAHTGFESWMDRQIDRV